MSATTMPTRILIKLLYRYSRPGFDHHNTVAFETDSQGRQHTVTIQGACELAADELLLRNVESAKFRCLVAGLKQYGVDDLYERIMHEPIDKAREG